MLMKQAGILRELPRLADTQSSLSKADRLREWRSIVDMKIAALHPLFEEWWTWTWRMGEDFHKLWI